MEKKQLELIIKAMLIITLAIIFLKAGALSRFNVVFLTHALFSIMLKKHK